jgi:hypothetical protein
LGHDAVATGLQLDGIHRWKAAHACRQKIPPRARRIQALN